MMKRFSPYGAPKQYVFVDPDTAHNYSAPDKQMLISDILAYREQNRLSIIENLSLVIDTYLCNLPENCGACEPAKLRRGFMTYLKGGMALVKNMLYTNVVSQEEADRRAEVCLSCPYNSFPDKSGFVQWSDEIAEHSTDGRKSKYHDQLGNCEVCTCVLKAKVWFGDPIKLNNKELTKMLAPGINCWQPGANR